MAYLFGLELRTDILQIIEILAKKINSMKLIFIQFV